MLKLEKISRNGMINVSVRDKEKFLTRPFVLAFLIAAAIHFGFVFLFHIAPFYLNMSETIFPPTHVQTDASSRESAIAELNPTVYAIRGLPPLPTSHPILAEHPSFLSIRPMEYIKANTPSVKIFQTIEQDILEPAFNPLSLFPKKPLEIMISGRLGEHKILFNEKKNPIPPLNLPYGSTRLSYNVLVEAKTGKIFWIELRQKEEGSAREKFVENLLKEMRFEIALNPIEIDVRGEIEFHFNDSR